MHSLRRLFDRPTRIVAGIMSGTSLDGIDAVVARLGGSGAGMAIELLGAASRPYPDALRALLLRNSAPETSSVREISNLGVRLAGLYAEAVAAALEDAGLGADALDLVGCHGQTVHHVPEPEDCAGAPVASTLQIGDAATLAHRTGAVVVSDFRSADLALGGQGAPLVPYFDWVYFADGDETRGLLNLGGIANLTVLPAGGAADAVYAFDTGPANMVVDALAARLFDRAYDPDGALAAEGEVDEALLAELLADDYLRRPPPKSTGRERYGAEYVDALLARRPPATARDRHDLLATATAFTAASIHDAYRRFVAGRHPLGVLIAAGGGVRNASLMRRLEDAFAPVPVRPADAYGLAAEAKEALCFAVLAHETLNGVATSLPAVTGAARPAVLGSVTAPPAAVDG